MLQAACLLAGPALVRYGIDHGVRGNDAGVITRATELFIASALLAYVFGRAVIMTVTRAGEILLQAGFSWAEDDADALEGARVWKGAQPDEFYTDDWHDPQAMYERGEEQVSDDDLKEQFIIGSDPAMHAERIREVEKLGATTVVLMNNSGADPHDAIAAYGERVLPALKS